MKRFIFVVLVVGNLIAGCSAASSANDGVLDGTWKLTSSGVADPSTSDDVLAEYNRYPLAFQLTLKSGVGTEQFTVMDGQSTCVAQHAFAIEMNTDGTGSLTESGPGTLVSGGAECDTSTTTNYSLFKAGTTTSLGRISLSGSRLVLVSSGSGSSSGREYFAVFLKE